MLNPDLVEQFIAVSYLYFLTTEKSASELSAKEVEELIVAINNDNERMTSGPMSLA